MKRPNQNDFTKSEVKEKSRYKLWVKYHGLEKPKNYYSYEKPGSPSYGYNRLMTLLINNRLKIKIAILFNNQTGEELERY